MDENKKPQEKIAEESEQTKVIKEAAENMALAYPQIFCTSC